jgi:hypothetical protein
LAMMRELSKLVNSEVETRELVEALTP